MKPLFAVILTLLLSINTFLLAGILWFLFDIRSHMPPTTGEMRSATGQKRVELKSRRPAALSVEVDTPLSVEVDNTPLEVEITR